MFVHFWNHFFSNFWMIAKRTFASKNQPRSRFTFHVHVYRNHYQQITAPLLSCSSPITSSRSTVTSNEDSASWIQRRIAYITLVKNVFPFLVLLAFHSTKTHLAKKKTPSSQLPPNRIDFHAVRITTVRPFVASRQHASYVIFPQIINSDQQAKENRSPRPVNARAMPDGRHTTEEAKCPVRVRVAIVAAPAERSRSKDDPNRVRWESNAGGGEREHKRCTRCVTRVTCWRMWCDIRLCCVRHRELLKSQENETKERVFYILWEGILCWWTKHIYAERFRTMFLFCFFYHRKTGPWETGMIHSYA